MTNNVKKVSEKYFYVLEYNSKTFPKQFLTYELAEAYINETIEKCNDKEKGLFIITESLMSFSVN